MEKKDSFFLKNNRILIVRHSTKTKKNIKRTRHSPSIRQTREADYYRQSSGILGMSEEGGCVDSSVHFSCLVESFPYHSKTCRLRDLHRWVVVKCEIVL